MKNSAVLLLEETVTRYPDKVGLRDGTQSYTFSQIRSLALEIASEIVSNIVSEVSKPIAILLPKSADSIICFMGILYSGNFYVPLDVKTPIERLKKIIKNLEPKAIITNEHYGKSLIDLGYERDRLIYLDKITFDVKKKYKTPEVVTKIIDSDPIYIIYTSGSTGTPKGVVISHRGVLDYTAWATECYKIDENTIIGNQSPFYFDNSTLDIYLCISTGATLIIIPEKLFAFPSKLIQYLNDNQINFIFWVPSVIINIANTDVFRHIRTLHLKKILFAGEVMPNRHLNYWRKHIVDALYSNLYGPTEITVDCTYYIVDREFDDSEPLPIGFPCKNSDVIILKNDNELAKVAEMGELCVRGSSLAMGYWNDTDKTESSFVQNPLNKNYPERIYRTGDLVMLNERNEIIYIGRKDTQVKHMGNRIELGEIEKAVISINNIDNACVIYNSVKQQITLFYETKFNINDIRIRTDLIKLLPKYMIPTKYHRFDRLPYTPNGKIDRVKLKDNYIE